MGYTVRVEYTAGGRYTIGRGCKVSWLSSPHQPSTPCKPYTPSMSLHLPPVMGPVASSAGIYIQCGAYGWCSTSTAAASESHPTPAPRCSLTQRSERKATSSQAPKAVEALPDPWPTDFSKQARLQASSHALGRPGLLEKSCGS